MKISELENKPDWLIRASTVDADVSVENGVVIWRGGEWRGGEWHGGEWHGGEDRVLYMAALCGIVFAFRDHGPTATALAYRTTQHDGHGRQNRDFTQPEGEYREAQLPPAGSGTCVQGIHVSTAATAWTYFGVDETCQMWEVEFTREDLLDCDGQKARIRGGVFRKIDTPFLLEVKK